jgi:glycosyltransferase involved in cell wall biosynthesis
MLDLAHLQIQAGHQTEIFSSEFRESDLNLDPNKATAASALNTATHILWSGDARRALKNRIKAFEPDVVHIHSISHQLSASVLYSVPKNTPVVMTLHDYKLAAPCYLLLRDSKPCTECIGLKVPLPAIRYRCVKNSRLASLICSTEQILHLRPFQTKIDRFIAPSTFAASLLKDSRAVSKDRISVVPHGVPTSQRIAKPSESRRFVFVGRLSPEKGLQDLLAAWEMSGIGKRGYKLDIVGDHPTAISFDETDPSVIRHGWLDRSGIETILSAARCVVVPSLCYETFGLVAAEALATGLPIITASSGALTALVTDSAAGALFEPGDRNALAQLLELHSQSTFGPHLDARGSTGRDFAARQLSPALMLDRTIQVYREAAYDREVELS